MVSEVVIFEIESAWRLFLLQNFDDFYRKRGTEASVALPQLFEALIHTVIFHDLTRYTFKNILATKKILHVPCPRWVVTRLAYSDFLDQIVDHVEACVRACVPDISVHSFCLQEEVMTDGSRHDAASMFQFVGTVLVRKLTGHCGLVEMMKSESRADFI